MTRQVYIQELKGREARDRRRALLEERYGAMLERPVDAPPEPAEADVVDIREAAQ